MRVCLLTHLISRRVDVKGFNVVLWKWNGKSLCLWVMATCKASKTHCRGTSCWASGHSNWLVSQRIARDCYLMRKVMFLEVYFGYLNPPTAKVQWNFWNDAHSSRVQSLIQKCVRRCFKRVIMPFKCTHYTGKVKLLKQSLTQLMWLHVLSSINYRLLCTWL